ncbi:MAG: hypothetical protein A2V66_17340 [Ignavibacteria bacterium RBG_13_36_8]|nr:MAG: hypothetical protein A2V66_17340 [Ignavibacteria bacterium RBG_13_36_8]
MAEWYKDWFADEDYLKVYCHRDDTDAEILIGTILSNIKIPVNAKILDAACGAGRHSILLAKKGFLVTAFDLSQTLLNMAVENSRSLGLDINFITADLRTIQLEHEFDLILNLFTSFGYFEKDEDNYKFVQKAFNFIAPGGYFVLDFLNRNNLLRNFKSRSQRLIQDMKILEERGIENDRIVKRIFLKRDGNQKEFFESVRLYSKDEIIYHFEEIGYKVYKIFGNYHGKPFDENDSERLIIIFNR